MAPRAFFVCIAVALVAPLFAHPAGAASTLPAFSRRWASDDGEVASGASQRSWTWGPRVLRSGLEPYAQSPDGRREIRYLDKRRMEITHPAANPDDEWYVSSGLLVRELISGEMQVGDQEYEAWQPADVPIAGDINAPAHQTITYGDLRPHASIRGEGRARPRAEGDPPLVTTITPGGALVDDQRFASYGLQTASYDDVLGHNIASVFLQALSADDLLYLAERPLVEPFWARVPVDGEPKDVLLQAFERRVLTYTPSNPEGWQVERGNVGRQYAYWRYGEEEDGRSFDPQRATEAGITVRPLSELSEPAANSLLGRDGVVGIAVYEPTARTLYVVEGTRRFTMYSTAKTLIMLAVLDQTLREGRELTEAERSLISAMIQVSDNDAATALFSSVGGAPAVQSYLTRIGILDTRIDPYSWGMSTTTPQDMALLMDKLGQCVILVPALCTYALETMEGVVPSQKWGVSGAMLEGSRVAIKNGWFPDQDGWGINSMGFVADAERGYAVAIFTAPNPSMEYGVATIEAVATEINRALR